MVQAVTCQSMPSAKGHSACSQKANTPSLSPCCGTWGFEEPPFDKSRRCLTVSTHLFHQLSVFFCWSPACPVLQLEQLSHHFCSTAAERPISLSHRCCAGSFATEAFNANKSNVFGHCQYIQIAHKNQLTVAFLTAFMEKTPALHIAILKRTKLPTHRQAELRTSLASNTQQHVQLLANMCFAPWNFALSVVPDSSVAHKRSYWWCLLVSVLRAFMFDVHYHSYFFFQGSSRKPRSSWTPITYATGCSSNSGGFSWRGRTLARI